MSMLCQKCIVGCTLLLANLTQLIGCNEPVKLVNPLPGPGKEEMKGQIEEIRPLDSDGGVIHFEYLDGMKSSLDCNRLFDEAKRVQILKRLKEAKKVELQFEYIYRPDSRYRLWIDGDEFVSKPINTPANLPTEN